jgi:hypothetical protein
MNMKENEFNPESFIAGYVSRYGENDGVCLITWLPDNFNGVVKNMGKATDILGVYYSAVDGSISFSVQDADDTYTLFPVGFYDFEPSVQNSLVDYFMNLYALAR